MTQERRPLKAYANDHTGVTVPLMVSFIVSRGEMMRGAARKVNILLVGVLEIEVFGIGGGVTVRGNLDLENDIVAGCEATGRWVGRTG